MGIRFLWQLGIRLTFLTETAFKKEPQRFGPALCHWWGYLLSLPIVFVLLRGGGQVFFGDRVAVWRL